MSYPKAYNKPSFDISINDLGNGTFLVFVSRKDDYSRLPDFFFKTALEAENFVELNFNY